IWAEALDNGDLKNKVPFRDKIVSLQAPFTGQAREILKIEQRFSGIQMAAQGGLALVEDSERLTRRVRTFLLDIDRQPDQAPKLVWSLNSQDRYRSPGTPLSKPTPNGGRVLVQDGGSIFLSGPGASPAGDHPFLDRFNLATLKAERLFRCDDDHYETVEALLDDSGGRFLTRRESPTEPPNYYVRTAGQMTAVTHFADPQPVFRQVGKQLVTYQRSDGVP